MRAAPRKTLKRFDEPGHARSLTFSTHDRLPLLSGDATARLVLDAIRRACLRHQFAVLAYVVMPEHVHLLVRPAPVSGADASSVSSLLFAIKRPVAFRMRQRFERERPEMLRRLTVRVRSGEPAFRFWLHGGGYDRNVVSRQRAIETAEYIHANPVRRGLCETPAAYPWSSWRQWHEPESPLPDWMPRVDRGSLA